MGLKINKFKTTKQKQVNWKKNGRKKIIALVDLFDCVPNDFSNTFIQKIRNN